MAPYGVIFYENGAINAILVYVLRGMRVRVDIFCLQIVHVIHHSKDDIELRHLV